VTVRRSAIALAPPAAMRYESAVIGE